MQDAEGEEGGGEGEAGGPEGDEEAFAVRVVRRRRVGRGVVVVVVVGGV